MQIHELLHILHLRIHGQLEASENLRNHLRSHIVVVMECPAYHRIPTLALCLAHVMQERRPPEPQSGSTPARVVHHLKRMIEIILMGLAATCLHYVERGKLGQYELHQPATVQLHQSAARGIGHHYLVQFVGYALAAHYRYA